MEALNLVSARRPAAVLACMFGLIGAAHATPDWQAAAATCVPDSKTTMGYEVTGNPGAWVSLTNTAVHTDGAKTVYFCNVLSPLDPVGAAPTWANLKLQFSNTNFNEVTAALYSKNKVSGGVALIALVTSSAAAGVQVNTAPLAGALNFVTNAYHIIITLKSYQGSTPRAHMVMVTD